MENLTIQILSSKDFWTNFLYFSPLAIIFILAFPPWEM